MNTRDLMPGTGRLPEAVPTPDPEARIRATEIVRLAAASPAPDP